MWVILFLISVGVIIFTGIIIKIFDSDIRESHFAKLTIDIVVMVALILIVLSLVNMFTKGV